MTDNKTCSVDILSVSLGESHGRRVNCVSRWLRLQTRWRGRWRTFRLIRRTRIGSRGCRQN